MQLQAFNTIHPTTTSTDTPCFNCTDTSGRQAIKVGHWIICETCRAEHDRKLAEGR